jgi:hypothetical protein
VEVTDRFRVCRAFDGALSCPLPVGHGVGDQPCLGVVVRQQFRPGLSRLRKSLCHYLRNALVILLARAFA